MASTSRRRKSCVSRRSLGRVGGVPPIGNGPFPRVTSDLLGHFVGVPVFGYAPLRLQLSHAARPHPHHVATRGFVTNGGMRCTVMLCGGGASISAPCMRTLSPGHVGRSGRAGSAGEVWGECGEVWGERGTALAPAQSSAVFRRLAMGRSDSSIDSLMRHFRWLHAPATPVEPRCTAPPSSPRGPSGVMTYMTNANARQIRGRRVDADGSPAETSAMQGVPTRSSHVPM